MPVVREDLLNSMFKAAYLNSRPDCFINDIESTFRGTKNKWVYTGYSLPDPLTYKDVYVDMGIAKKNVLKMVPLCCGITLLEEYLKEIRHKNFKYNSEDIQEWFNNGQISITNRQIRNTYKWDEEERERKSHSKGNGRYY